MPFKWDKPVEKDGAISLKLEALILLTGILPENSAAIKRDYRSGRIFVQRTELTLWLSSKAASISENISA